MAFVSSDSESSEDEETKKRAEIARKEKLARLKAEAEETARRRRAAREDYENGRFAKATRMEPETLATILGKKTLFMSPEEKEEFNGMIMKVVFHFETCPVFINQIASMDDKTQLLYLIRTAHQRITTKNDSEETEENMNLHNFLVNYQKQVVSALRDLTKIPKDTVIIEVESGNVFEDARKDLLKKESFEMYRDQERKRLLREKQKTQETVDSITSKLVNCQIGNVAGRDNLARDISNAVVLEIEESTEGRSSSPTRHNLSKESLECITTICNRFKVNCNVRNLPGTSSQPDAQEAPAFELKMEEDSESESSSDDEDGNFMMDSLFDQRNHIPTISAPSRQISASPEVKEEMEVDEESDEEEVQAPAGEDGRGRETDEEPDFESKAVKKGKEEGKKYIHGTDYSRHDRKVVENVEEETERFEDRPQYEEYMRRINEVVVSSRKELHEKQVYYFPANYQSDMLHKEALKDWEHQSMSDIGKKRKVAFAPFESPLNKMRVFMKPNMALSLIDGCDMDDGPTHLWTEYQLKEGWNALLNSGVKFPLTLRLNNAQCVRYDRKSNLVQRLTTPVANWMLGHQGNLLGRFWYQRFPELDNVASDNSARRENLENYQNSRKIHGVLRYITQTDLADILKRNWEDIRHDMHRGIFRPYLRDQKPDVKGKVRKFNFEEGCSGKMSSVLLLTDWRLVYLEPLAIHNATIKFLPSQIGPVFFKSMLTLLTKFLLDANLEIRTIIFAFGGSPMFAMRDFSDFWKKFVMLSRRCVDVHWFAQDWLDGMNFDPEDMDTLNLFNAYTKRAVDNMRKAGNMNYHWHNIREQHNIPLQPPILYKRPDTIVLEPIYNFYVRHFANHCNVFPRSSFFVTNHRQLDDHPEASSLNPQACLVYKNTDKRDDETDDEEED